MVLAFTLTLGLTASALAAPQEAPRIALWPDGAPDEPAGIAERARPAETGTDGILRIRYVDSPTITVYRPPAETASGCCVVVAPGGGYDILAWNHEGTEVAAWLNSIGVTAVLLEYRVPRRDPARPHPWPLQDAQRAIRLTRANAEAWGVDPDRVGMLGFSAGGHLTMVTGTHSGAPTYERVDDADTLSARPDFLVPIYAAYLAHPDDPARLAPEIELTEEAPPTFMTVTLDDRTRGVDAARVLIELQSLGVECELHVFARGGHGYGMRDTGRPVHGWPKLCAAWLDELGLLDQRERGK
ncbi:MAG: alpha/beta hydrolase [Planctomycetota bacterium]